MEPNFLAAPNDALARGSDWSARADSTLQHRPVGDAPASTEFGGRTSTATSSVSAATSTVAPASPMHRTLHVSPREHLHGQNGWSASAVSVPGGPMVHPLAGPGAMVLPRSKGLYLRGGKRVLDVLGALIGLVVSAPVLALAALAIKLESRGPVLYRSTRIGRGGVPFTFLKLRSMVDGADRTRHQLSHLNETDGPVFKMARDPRVTRVGRFLRQSSIDELPQLWNVLCGEMSMVGPRPPIPEEVAQYEPWQMRRLSVRPGLTCLWQISGRSRIGFQEWMRLDLEYIKQQSFGMDLKLLVRTLPAVLSREGAY